ncbi:MAG: hypothetical protein QF535_13790, partial [Anaerolineales bacterium]|nr:hypothetical protein [Anaerolineales bacterium]
APAGFGILGSSMTESSGLFTFPTTGFWYVQAVANWNFTAGEAYAYVNISVTDDGSTARWTGIAFTHCEGGVEVYGSATTNTIVDVTDTSLIKVHMGVTQEDSGNYTITDTSNTRTGMTFIRLGAT